MPSRTGRACWFCRDLTSNRDLEKIPHTRLVWTASSWVSDEAKKIGKLVPEPTCPPLGPCLPGLLRNTSNIENAMGHVVVLVLVLVFVTVTATLAEKGVSVCHHHQQHGQPVENDATRIVIGVLSGGITVPMWYKLICWSALVEMVPAPVLIGGSHLGWGGNFTPVVEFFHRRNRYRKWRGVTVVDFRWNSLKLNFIYCVNLSKFTKLKLNSTDFEAFWLDWR